MLKGIIFDFDGVIVESLQVKTDAFAELYQSYGENVTKKVVKHNQANGGMSRFEKIKLYHESLLNKMITNEEIEELAGQFSKLVVKKVIKSPYVSGVLEFIQKSAKKYKLFISTGTPTDEIKYILDKRGISKYFMEIYGSPEEKSVHLSKIIDNYNYYPNELVFYGDASTDIYAAEKTNIPFVLIKNNFNEQIVKSFKGKIISNFKSLL